MGTIAGASWLQQNAFVEVASFSHLGCCSANTEAAWSSSSSNPTPVPPAKTVRREVASLTADLVADPMAAMGPIVFLWSQAATKTTEGFTMQISHYLQLRIISNACSSCFAPCVGEGGNDDAE